MDQREQHQFGSVLKNVANTVTMQGFGEQVNKIMDSIVSSNEQLTRTY